MKFLAHISCLPNYLNVFTLHEVTSEIDLLLLFLGGTSLAYILQNHKMWQYSTIWILRTHQIYVMQVTKW